VTVGRAEPTDRRADGGNAVNRLRALVRGVSRSTDDESCPVCGEAYAERIVVERGDRWADLFPGSPLDYFQRYRRRCATDYDDRDGRELRDGRTAVYFHSSRHRRSTF
jgi:rRNA maturation protein Nop10